ncbi:histone deacetylase family protein [Plastoroseomonas arctica]|uniref:Histone deacetylase family protein n=1 Tax=Plastoroseomonas arctica TaxID=1509237 RepID=A0AAF1JU00_9PROT|nr:histone deacetylase family protein [Plastoroseomonas arctica]MBR0653476.1 histone deacetylase family protein [Plastoroseomonas arctica]
MKTFHAPGDAQHAPRFFLMRGAVRPNFEVPARAEALRSGLAALGLAPEVAARAPRDALEAVHSAAYLDFLQGVHAAWQRLGGAGPEVVANIHPAPEMAAQGAAPGGLIGQVGWYTADTACPIGAGTWAASVDAAGCALAAAEAVLAGGSAYALCRPPGHHAYSARAGGHCYLNNAAVAVEALLRGGAARVAVLDIDSHHGNGTQGIFWERPDVLTVSVHGDPDGYYPWYVGRAHERGGGSGEGFNVNLPVAVGSDDGPWLEAVSAGISRVDTFAPDALVVSLGFDASVHEPLNALGVSDEGFARAGGLIAGLRVPVVFVQEGGYAVDHLGDLLARFLGGFLGR